MWAPRNEGIQGNEISDSLVRYKGVDMKFFGRKPFVGLAKMSLKKIHPKQNT